MSAPPVVFETERKRRDTRWQHRELTAVIESELPRLETSEGRTEVANARRLVAASGADFRWVPDWQKYIAWNQRCWNLDAPEIEKFAKDTAGELWVTFALLPIEKLERGHLNQILSFIRASNSATGIRNMLYLARSEPGIAIDFSDLDQRPMAFNCANVCIDLDTGKPRPHDREDYLTKTSGVVFDPAAKCPTWERFLIEIFAGDCELIDFVWRAAGYCLTGLIVEHLLFFLFGLGRNGKTTFITTLQYLWGDYATTLRSDLLMIAKGERHPTEMCDLYGARLAVANETEEGRRMAEVAVKAMTGGDVLKGRRMREDFWQFRPTHKLWLSGNHRPRIIGTDDAIWDRVALIPFTERFAPEDSRTDPNLPEKLQAEASGILNWAIKGCLDWQRNGLQKPTVVQAATQEYRAQEDSLGQFLADYCVLSDQCQTGATALYECYQRWGGELLQTSFGRALAERGYLSDRASSGPNRGRRIWFGIGLLREDEHA